jgi:hypothetical protein
MIRGPGIKPTALLVLLVFWIGVPLDARATEKQHEPRWSVEWQKLWETIPGKERCSRPIEYKVAASDESVGLAFTRKCESMQEYDRVSPIDRHGFLEVFFLDLATGAVKAKFGAIADVSRIELHATAKGNFLLSWWIASNPRKQNTTTLLLLAPDAKALNSLELTATPDDAFPGRGWSVHLSPTRQTVLMSCSKAKQTTARALNTDSLNQLAAWTVEDKYGPEIQGVSDTSFIALRWSQSYEGLEPATGSFGETNVSEWRGLPPFVAPSFLNEKSLLQLKSDMMSDKKMSEARVEVLDLEGLLVASKTLRSSRWDSNYISRSAISSDGSVLAVNVHHSSRFIEALDTFGLLHAEIHVLRGDTLEELLQVDASKSPSAFCLTGDGRALVAIKGSDLSAITVRVL